MNGLIAGITSALLVSVILLLHEQGVVSLGWLIWSIVLTGVPFVLYNVALWGLKEDAGTRFARWVAHGGPYRPYRDWLQRWLDRFDHWLCPPEYLDGASPHHEQPPSAARAWNWHAYDRHLLWSVAYPIGLAIVLWIALGTPIQIGPLEVIPKAESGWQRAALALSLSLLVFNLPLARVILEKLVLPFITRTLGRAAPRELVILLVRGGLILGAVAGAFAVAGAVAVAFTVEKSVSKRLDSSRWPRPSRVYLILTLIMVLQVVFAAHLLPVAGSIAEFDFSETARKQIAVLILFLGLFPLINALFDFASPGLTRYCLRQSIQHKPIFGLPASLRPIVFNICDLFGAVVLLAGLVICLLCGMHVLNAVSGAPLMPVADLMANLRDSRPDAPPMGWAYAMVLSTLLPTLAHLGLGAMGLVASIRCAGPGKSLPRRS